jgi:hypothetical protein
LPVPSKHFALENTYDREELERVGEDEGDTVEKLESMNRGKAVGLGEAGDGTCHRWR